MVWLDQAHQQIDLTGVEWIKFSYLLSSTVGNMHLYVYIYDSGATMPGGALYSHTFDETVTSDWVDVTIDVTSSAFQKPLLFGWIFDPTSDGYKGYLDNIRTGPSLPPPPVSDFSGSPLSGAVPFNVVFTDSSTNTPTSWAWAFGDTGTSTEQSPTHSYTTAGVYTVELVATNAGGSDTETKTDYITANAALSGSPTISLNPARRGIGISAENGEIWGP